MKLQMTRFSIQWPAIMHRAEHQTIPFFMSISFEQCHMHIDLQKISNVSLLQEVISMSLNAVSEIRKHLEKVPKNLWVSQSNEVGLVQCTPYQVQPKNNRAK